MGKICSKCGHDNGSSAIYCAQCDTRLSILKSDKKPEESAPIESSNEPFTPSGDKPKLQINKPAPQPQQQPPMGGGNSLQDQLFKEPDRIAQPKQKKKGLGCLYTFILLILFFVLMLAAAIIAGYKLKVIPLLSEKPQTITAAKPTDADIKQLETKLAQLTVPKPTAVILSDKDLNDALSHYAPYNNLKGMVQFTIRGETMRITFSINPKELFAPLEYIDNQPGYLNGTIDIKVKTKDKKITIILNKVNFDKKEITEYLNSEYLNKDILEELPSMASTFIPIISEIKNNLQSLNIIEGKIYILRKAPANIK